MKKFLCLFLSLVIFSNVFIPFSAITFSSDQIESLGYITSLEQELLSYGLVYSELSAEKDKNQKAFIFEYTPNQFTRPQVEFGSNTSSKVRLKDITEQYEAEGARVVGAMNGDFFSFQTGVPMGVVIKNGKLISSDPSKNAIGFTEYGSAVIGNPNIHFNFSYAPTDVADNTETAEQRVPYSFIVDYFNKYPSVYAIYFLNDSYSKTTKSASPSTEIILKPLSGEPILNSDMSFEVTQINLNAVNGDIPHGHYVLCGDDRSFAASLEPIQVGDIINLRIEADISWNQVDTALGGGDIIVENGEFIPQTVDEYHEKISNPRTAIGVRENGDAVFFAIDGRDSKNAVGVNIKTLAEIMIELGCITVINLDGGGSTTVYATTPFDSSAKLVNNPSDGSERYISNAILFLNEMPMSEETGGVKISSEHNYMMIGSSLEINPIYHDKSYRPFVPSDKTTYIEQTHNNRLHGEFDENIFTATKSGTATLAAVNGNTKGILVITLLDSPSEFICNEAGITVEIGESVPLDISAVYNGEEVLFNNLDILNFKIREIQYEDDESTVIDFPSVGYILDNSFFGNEFFDGILEISMEETKLEIPLKVIPKAYTDSISYNDISASYNDTELEVEECEEDYLDKKFFNISIPTDETSQGGTLLLNSKDNLLNSATKSIVFLSRNVMSPNLYIEDSKGDEICVPYTIERDYGVFNGWYKYKADLSQVLTDSNEAYTIKHLMACSTIPQNVFVMGDFCKITGDEILFSDIENSWAKEHIIDVYYQELMKGKPYYTTNIFDGNASLTRAEFATVLCRFLDVDLTKFVEQPLEFADIETVGSWAWNQIRAVNALGIMSGSEEDDGQRYFRPQDGITRAEAMQVIGRLLKAPENTVSMQFNDNDTLPAWSLENTAKVVTYNIFSGYEDNTIRPFNKLTRNEAAKIFSLFNTQSFFNLINIKTEPLN